ncbi:unnamed protein product [Caenorhabditis brenneri]
MSNQPSTSAAYYQQRRWSDSEEGSSGDDDRGRMATSTREIPAKNKSAGGVDHSEVSDENGSDNDEVEAPSERRGQGKPGKDGVKSCAQLQARSDGGQLAKKPKAKPGFFDGPPPGEETDNGEEEDEESTTQPLIRSRKGRLAKKPKGRFAKKTKAPSPDASPRPARESDDSEDEEVMQPPKKKKATVLTAEQAKNRKKLNDLNRKKTAQWNAAENLQAARDQERTAKRVRPLNRYIQNRPPSPEMESDEEPKLPPPPPTEKQLAARLAANEKRRRKDRERKEKREQMLARKRETERKRRLDPSAFPMSMGRGSIEGVPSTRTTDRTGRTTTWEQWRRVIWYDEEEKAKEWKRRVKENNKPIHQSKPRTGPAANNGIYAAESMRQLEKEEKNGFKNVTHRTKKKEETDSEEDDAEPKSRYHSAKTLKILEDEFKNAQYLDVKTTRRLVRITKLKSRQISNWFANTRRKVQQKFKNGKIAELPKQMKALEEMNEERKERGEHLRMKKERWESDDDSEDEEEDVDDEETQDDEEDVEEGEDDNEEDDGNRRNQMKKVIDHLSTEGYPVYPGWR